MKHSLRDMEELWEVRLGKGPLVFHLGRGWEPGGLQSLGSQRVGCGWATSVSLLCIGEGNGNPLQCSCLENPRDSGAWWAAVCGVTRSRT